MQRHILPCRPMSRGRRGGAVIIVVLALLSLLIFLGVFFFEFAQEEQMASINYATSPFAELVNPDELFDEAARQLIVGPDSSRPMSALQSSTSGQAFTLSAPSGLPAYGTPGSMHSMVSHVLGRVTSAANPAATDVLPHNGHGVRPFHYDLDSDGIVDPWIDSNGDDDFDTTEGDFITYDLDGDGAEDATLFPMDVTAYPGYSAFPLFGLNFSRPAQANPSRDAFTQPVPVGPSPYGPLRPYQPDVEYVYPDMNSPFLAYEVVVNNRRILVPSFVRPDMLSSYRLYNSTNTNLVGAKDLYRDTKSLRLVLRPHAQHRYPNGTYRFLSAGIQAQSGDQSRVLSPFPFEVDTDRDGNPNEMGIYSLDASNPASPVLSENYEYDVDVTGDGDADSIWIDLGMGIQTMSDGRQFVPLFAFHVLDADSNINLNTAGNLQGMLVNGAAYNTAPFSVSNSGVNASEINPIRALTGNPAQLATRTDLQLAQFQQAYNFNFDPTIPLNTAAMANVEMYALLAGRMQGRRVGSGVVSMGPLTGRYGDENAVARFAGTPTTGPGVFGTDDDGDTTSAGARYEGGAFRSSVVYRDPRGGAGGTIGNAPLPYASHPVSQLGTGSEAYSTTGRLVSTVAATSGPVIWPVYPGGMEARNPATFTPGVNDIHVNESPYPYGSTDKTGTSTNPDLGSTIFPQAVTQTSTMSDEEDEITLEPGSTSITPDDDVFGPYENIPLQVSTADASRLGLASRVANLAPFNFLYARNSENIRRIFTTSSWDFSELTYVPTRVQTVMGTTYRPETSAWSPGRYLFPPALGTAEFAARDPFRPELRMLLASEDTNYVNPTANPRRELTTSTGFLNGNTGDPAQYWRQPLNLNKLLVGFDAEGKPIYRSLMPHPEIRDSGLTDVSANGNGNGNGNGNANGNANGNGNGNANGNANGVAGVGSISNMIHDHNDVVPAAAQISNINGTATASNAEAMEWWARYDRQRLARDIFTILYLVGAPQDMDPSTGAIETPLTTPYDPEIVREMAQFAVNYVDSMDRDNVITKFEYDNDLTDGWDDPTHVVYGVERSSLTFSEVQFVQVTPKSSDHTVTLHDETDDVHQYLHIELRNGSPFPVILDEGWRISRVARGTGTIDASVEFERKSLNDYKQVDPGQNFHISMHDGYVENGAGNLIWSDLYADSTGDARLECALPSGGAAIANNNANPNPLADLDLGRVGQASPYDFENYYTLQPGTTAFSTNLGNRAADGNLSLVKRLHVASGQATPEDVEFDLVLERRQNLNGVNDSTRGDWIEVDRFHVEDDQMSSSVAAAAPPSKAQLDVVSNTQTDVQTALQFLNSRERRQLFDPVQLPNADAGTADQKMHHSIAIGANRHNANSVSPNPFTHWEPHFDRDLTSKYELMSVPLYGNWPLSELVSATNTLAPTANQFYKEIHGGTQFNLAPGAGATTTGRMSGDFTAGIRFKFPNGLPAKPYQGWNPYTYQNSWYRLLDFVTVPRRSDYQTDGVADADGGIVPVFRTPGKINLNTIRDESVFAALLDDNVHLQYGNATNDVITPGRNWFQEMLLSRDGMDAFAIAAGQADVPLPNSIASRPFRGTAQFDPNWASTLDDRSIENGLLRSVIRRNGIGLSSRPAGIIAATSLSPTTTFEDTGLWGTTPTPTHDTSTMTWQAVFDAGDRDATNLDHHTRDRILSKVANNSTSKSHVFYVWMAVGYFEAHETTVSGTRYPQIGARITDLPIHRKFMMVDMSKIDNAYDATTNSFDYRSFILQDSEKRLR